MEPFTESELDSLDARLIALWQCETDAGFNEWSQRVYRVVQALVERRIEKVQTERDLLAQAMWDVRTSFAFDTDGDTKYHSTDFDQIAAMFKRDMEEVGEDHYAEIKDLEQRIRILEQIEGGR